MTYEHFISFWSAISFLGNWKFIVAATLLVLGWLWSKKYHREAVAFGGTLFLGEVITYLAKIFFRHPRPLDALVTVDDAYSFPSGHSMIAVAFYGMFVTLLLRYVVLHRWGRVGLVSALGALIMLIGASRVILGVHYAEDVLAGYALGALFWVTFFFVTRHKATKKGR